MKNMISFSALMLAMYFAPIAYASSESASVGGAFFRGMILGLTMMLLAGLFRLLVRAVKFIYNKLFK